MPDKKRRKRNNESKKSQEKRGTEINKETANSRKLMAHGSATLGAKG